MSLTDVLNVDCPGCGQHGGHIVSMPVDAPVSYKCLQCGHEWELRETVCVDLPTNTD
jgi:predicted RNA-binding Zn-ribbon protein involved in translation (DUF1610 family)